MKRIFFILCIALFMLPARARTQVLTLAADSAAGFQGDTVETVIRAFNFQSILSMQGTLRFDPQVVRLDTVHRYGLPGMNPGGFGTNLSGQGIVTWSWNDNFLNGVSVSDSTVLFALRWILTGAPGSVSPVRFSSSPTLLEFVDSSFSQVSFDTAGSVVSVTDTTMTGLADATGPPSTGVSSGELLAMQVFPSPAGPDSRIGFSIGASGSFSLVLLDIHGNKLGALNSTLSPGHYELPLAALIGGGDRWSFDRENGQSEVSEAAGVDRLNSASWHAGSGSRQFLPAGSGAGQSLSAGSSADRFLPAGSGTGQSLSAGSSAGRFLPAGSGTGQSLSAGSSAGRFLPAGMYVLVLRSETRNHNLKFLIK